MEPKSELCSLGGIVFEIVRATNLMLNYHIQNFSDLKVSRSVSYAETKIAGRTSRLTFTGRSPYDLSMRIRWSLLLNPDKNDTLELLQTYADEGRVIPFYMGGKKYLNANWVIVSFDISDGRYNPAGVMYEATVNIKLKEYVK